jgi:hypothetical protein
MKKALVAYVALGLLIFAPALNAWFVGDDWDYFVLIARATSPLVCFTPLLGRFIRPLAVATYYVNFTLFGLRPLPYHVLLVLIHAINAWLVSLLALRLGLSRFVAFAAGLVFLVFAGHSEAVIWLGGAADPWLALLLIPALLLFDRSLTAERPAIPLAAACGMLALCVLAKETAAIGGPIFTVYGGSLLFTSVPPAARRRIIVRTVTAASISFAVTLASLAVRALVFKSVFGAYRELGTSLGMALPMARAFLLRCFFPSGLPLMRFWALGYDGVLIAVATLFALVMFVRRPETRRGIAFLVAALVIALAPMFPLSISLVDSVSERYVYVPTVFSSILLAWFAELTFRRRFAVVAIAAFAGIHLVALERANRAWVEAGALGHRVTTEFIERVRAAPPPAHVFVLNTPDTAAGAYVVRGAFYGSFHVTAPDVVEPETRLTSVAVTALTSAREHARVEQIGPRSFRIVQDSGNFLSVIAPPPTVQYRFDRWDGRSFDVTFTDSPEPAQVLYVSRGRVGTAGEMR